MNILGLIVARSGSQGVPGKNVMTIAGQPCVSWTIEAGLDALHRQALDVLGVSTDCEIVTELAMAKGLAVVSRPAELAGPQARVDDAMRHAVSIIEARLDRVFDGVALLYANVPVRPPGLIERAVAMFRSTGCDSVQSYSAVGKHHPCWTAVLDDATGVVRPYQGDTLNGGIYRRQDLPSAHIPDGGVLVVSRAALLGEIAGVPDGPHAFLGKDRRGVLTRVGDVVDIDNPIDAMVADAVLRQRIDEKQSLEDSIGGTGEFASRRVA
jgi:CMP-N,N'-diacetyllegionaminic acid synthase